MRPSKAVKVLKSARLDLEIEAGISVWVARRREKGRQRARMHRERTQGGEANPSAEPLESPEAAAAARKEAARKEIQDFRASLLQADGQPRKFRRAPDSQRRKEAKRLRRQTRRNDDASRDTNHAIAHAYPLGGEVVVRQTTLWPAGQGVRPSLPIELFGILVAASLFLAVGACLAIRRWVHARPSMGQANSRGPVSGPGKNNKMPNPLQGPTSGQISSERTHTEILPDASRGLVSSPVTPAPPPAAEPTYGRRIRLEAGTVDPEGIPRWHRSECLRPRTQSMGGAVQRLCRPTGVCAAFRSRPRDSERREVASGRVRSHPGPQTDPLRTVSVSPG